MEIKTFLSIAVAALTAASSQAQMPSTGTYFSAQLLQPPLPFNPFPELPVVALGGGAFVYNDMKVDYVQLRAEAEAMKAALGESELVVEQESGSGSSALMSGGGLVLQIELSGDDGRRVSFESQPGLVYEIQQSSNLVNWTVLDTVVANRTNIAFYAFGQDVQFYRVVQGSDLIQFPDFHQTVEQSAFIDVYTPLRGEARVKIYRDGNLWHDVIGGVPSSGLFRVSDNLYNPANWPYDGYYNATNWEFRITIVATNEISPAATSTNQGIVYKKGRVRVPQHTGITVQQHGALGALTPVVQGEVDDYMDLYFLANLIVGQQLNLDGAVLNEFSSPPKIFNQQDRDKLRTILFGGTTNSSLPYCDRLHYFGHGTNTSFTGIRVSELKTNIFCVAPFTFVVLDGCRTAQTTDMLGEMTCYWGTTTLMELKDRGLTPGFGCGWNNTKNVGSIYSQGSLLHRHFYFWVDFYGVDGGLTHRDLPNGYFDITYQEAYLFAKDPLGRGVSPTIQSNFEAGGWVRVGCTDCFFDL